MVANEEPTIPAPREGNNKMFTREDLDTAATFQVLPVWWLPFPYCLRSCGGCDTPYCPRRSEQKHLVCSRHWIAIPDRIEDPAFLAIVEQILKLARCEAHVLLFGETGAGKIIGQRLRSYHGKEEE
jgi:hypothetical protein